MAWLAIDKDGSEYIYDQKPAKAGTYWYSYYSSDHNMSLPKGSIEKLIGIKLTWEDDPVEIF